MKNDVPNRLEYSVGILKLKMQYLHKKLSKEMEMKNLICYQPRRVQSQYTNN